MQEISVSASFSEERNNRLNALRRETRRVSGAAISFSLALSALFSFAPFSAHAGGYELVKGKGVEVCEAYEKNLNAVHLTEPLLCEREINPQFKDFTKPEWKEIDLEMNKRLLWSVYSVFHSAIAAQTPALISDEGVDGAIKKWINLRSQRLYTAQADIDNDGRMENVLMYSDGICGVAQFAYATSLLVQRNGESPVDREKTELLNQNTWKNQKTGEVKRDIAYYLFNMYSVFRYKDVTYFDKSDARPEGRDILDVYQIVLNRAQHVCNYRFIKD